jgi:hypothetical protein
VEGRIRHHHFGEGDYAESEHVIQELLREAGHQIVASGTVFVSGTGVEEAADMKDVESLRPISARITLRTSRLLAVPFRTRPTITRPPRHLPSPMGQRLYQLVRLTRDVTDHTFETRFLGSGATADSFTFG